MNVEEYEKFEKMSDSDRRDIFEIVAEKRGIRSSYVEKDYWVCRTLGVLMKQRPYQPKCYFKGGTSLSKGFELIKRFSEDIDVIFSRPGLGIKDADDPTDPTREMSNKRRRALLEEVKAKSNSHMSGPLVQKLSAAFPACEVAYVEGPPEWYVSVKFKAVCEQDGYAGPFIKIEGGARGALAPTVEREVVPYAQDVLDSGKLKLDLRIAKMTMIKPERTMLEKLVAIHGINSRIANNDTEKKLTDANRCSRHFYDVAQIAQTPFGKRAMSDPELFAGVVSHSALAFPGAAFRYDLAKPSTISIAPTEKAQAVLERDYVAMAPMMFGKVPPFKDIVKRLAIVQDTIRELDERQMILDLA